MEFNYIYTLLIVTLFGIISLFKREYKYTSMFTLAKKKWSAGYIALSSKAITKVMGVILLFCINVNVYSQSDYKQEVISLVEQAKQSIAKKDYITARRILEGSLVYDVHKDSIEYYLQFIDYQKGIDNIEPFFQKKDYIQVVTQFKELSSKYEEFASMPPQWILRCEAIVKAQNDGRAVTKELANVIKMYSGVPMQGFIDGYTLIWLSFDTRMAKEMSDLAAKGYMDYNNYYLPNKDRKNCYVIISKNAKSSKIDIPNSWMGLFSDGMSLAHYGLTDKKHKQIVYIQSDTKRLYLDYDEGKDFHEGLAAVRKGGKWGYINKSGVEVIPCQFEEARRFSEGLAMVRTRKLKKGQCGSLNDNIIYINKLGTVVISGISESGAMGWANDLGRISYGLDTNPDFSDGIANDSEIAFDKNGNILFRYPKQDEFFPAYSDVGEYKCGMALVRKMGRERMSVDWDGPFGYINQKGEVVIPLKWDDAYDFSEDYAWVAQGKNSYGCINKDGQTIIPFEYEKGYNLSHYYQQGGYVFSEGLAGVKKNGKWGFVDYSGNIVIPFVYDEVFNFSEGFAWVKKEGKWGLVDKFGITTFDY